MYNYNKSNIFRLAWQFARQTGESFSICLKKAWANEKLKARMRKEIVHFYFIKVNGEKREAFGTLQSEYPYSDGKKKNPTIQSYFDTEKQDWRCFKKFNLVIA